MKRVKMRTKPESEIGVRVAVPGVTPESDSKSEPRSIPRSTFSSPLSKFSASERTWRHFTERKRDSHAVEFCPVHPLPGLVFFPPQADPVVSGPLVAHQETL